MSDPVATLAITACALRPEASLEGLAAMAVFVALAWRVSRARPAAPGSRSAQRSV